MWERWGATIEQVVCLKRACDPCVAAHLAAQEREQREQEGMTLRDRWKEAGLTESMFRRTLASFDTRPLERRVDGTMITTVMDDVDDMMAHLHDDPAPWLVLWGERGTGKTHLATGMLIEVCRRGGRGLFRTGKEMLDELRATHAPGAVETEAEVQRRWSRLSLVVIDDVGVRMDQQTPFAAEAYWAVIDGRYRQGGPLVMTTNLSPDALTAHLGQAAASRISERALVSEVKAADYRVTLRRALPTPIGPAVLAGEPADVPF